MRRLFIGLVVAATTVLLPVWALASNQEVAEQIADNLRDAQLQSYKVGVKFQDGTAWLRGKVDSEQQLARVLVIVSKTDGVERVVNRLDVSQRTAAAKTFKARLKTPTRTLLPEQVSGPAAPIERRCSGRISRPASRLQQVVDGKVSPTGSNVSERQTRLLASKYVLQRARPTAAQTAVAAQRAGQPVRQPIAGQPVPVAYVDGEPDMMPGAGGGPVPAYSAPMGAGAAPARYDQPCMPNYSWPSYAAYPNYAALTYPKQYSPTAWPYIGPFYPYPQVPLGWRKVTLEWDDGWWMLDFKDSCCH